MLHDAAPRARIVAVKAALKVGSFAEAAQHFKELKSMWSGLSSTEPSCARARTVADSAPPRSWGAPRQDTCLSRRAP